MEKFNLNRMIQSTFLISSLGLVSVNSFAQQTSSQENVPVVESKKSLEQVASEEKSKLGTNSGSTAESHKKEDDEWQDYKKQFEQANPFYEIKFNDDYSAYKVIESKDDLDMSEDDESLIKVSEDDVFYIRRVGDWQETKPKKRKKRVRFVWNDEEESYEDCWNFGKVSCNARDGFHYAFSFVSSGGDDFYQESGEATDIKSYASYRIQIASFFVETPGMATRRIHGLYAGRAWGFNFYNTDQWRLDLYKQRDTRGIRDLEGIQVRNKRTRAGLRLTGFFDSSLLQMNVSPYSTSDQKDDGVAASISYSHFWQLRNLSIYGSAGVQYQPKEVVSFYETQPASFAEREDRINQDVELGFEYPISKHWVFGGFAAYSRTNLAIPGVSSLEQVNSTEDKVDGFRSGLLLSLVF
ncbi:MAG: hypothetical protein HWE10_08540 [Gammaproteobacteria bacterium]|nr:hypothetical protein [Gammaproteobacteria bacterium]